MGSFLEGYASLGTTLHHNKEGIARAPLGIVAPKQTSIADCPKALDPSADRVHGAKLYATVALLCTGTRDRLSSVGHRFTQKILEMEPFLLFLFGIART